MAPLNVNKAACLKPVLGEMERRKSIKCVLIMMLVLIVSMEMCNDMNKGH